ncbi:MAG: ATP-binding protein [Pseudomonadota bacterium]
MILTPTILISSAVILVLGVCLGAVLARMLGPKTAEADALRVQLEDAIEAIEDGFIIFDKDDRIVTLNTPIRRQFGAIGDTIGRGDTYEDVAMRIAKSGMVPGVEGKEREFVDGLVEKRKSELGLTKIFQTHDGRWIRQRDKRTDAGNIVGVRTDVTQIKDNEIALEKALERAEAGDRAKSMFLASMSHEIRTPMNGILGMADLLAETDMTGDQTRLVDTIQGSATSLMQILNDILDYSKLAAGKMTLEERPFCPAKLAQEAVGLFAAQADRKGLGWTCVLEDVVPGQLIGDAGRLRQVLLNLLGNALKFTEQGEVSLLLSGKVEGERYALTLAVVDTGIGIPEDRISAVFDSFEQAEDGTSRRFGGTGLGLCISRQLARQMGGDLSVTSVVGQGSVFSLSLLLPIIDKADAAVEAPPEPGANMPDLSSVDILVAEDNATNRLLMSKFLEPTKAKINFAHDGHKAIATYKSAAPDLILMDVSMPKCSGIEATEAIRQFELENGLPRCQIIALTANAFEEDRRACFAAGMDGFLSKPLRRSDLYAELSRFAPEKFLKEEKHPVEATA